jgi:hypothetical protein
MQLVKNGQKQNAINTLPKRKTFSFHIQPMIMKQFKIKCIEQDVSPARILEHIITKWMEKN